MILTYGGGDPVVRAYRALGARDCVPIYNALDPSTHYPVPPRPALRGDLGFLGNRLPDREARVEEFFLRAGRAAAATARFCWAATAGRTSHCPPTCAISATFTRAITTPSTARRGAVLNVIRESMARYGFSPATRVFEAAGAGACLITDAWEGIELFLEPGREVLVARDGAEVAGAPGGAHARSARARIGAGGYRRVAGRTHLRAPRGAAWKLCWKAGRCGGAS